MWNEPSDVTEMMISRSATCMNLRHLDSFERSKNFIDKALDRNEEKDVRILEFCRFCSFRFYVVKVLVGVILRLEQGEQFESTWSEDCKALS